MRVCMIDLKLGDELLFETPVAFLLQTDLWEMVQHNGPAGMAVLAILICFSVYSWTIIFSKLGSLRGAGKANSRFLRAFRKASGMEAVMVASEQFRPSPLVAVFDFGYEELERQVKARGSVTNRTALERTLQLGVSEEIAKLETEVKKMDQRLGNADYVSRAPEEIVEELRERREEEAASAEKLKAALKQIQGAA